MSDDQVKAAEIFGDHPGFFDLEFVRSTSKAAAKHSDDALIQSMLDPTNTTPFDPNCIFDVGFHRQNMSDPATQQYVNPILHYLLEGAAQNAWPNPFFDPRFYRRNVGSSLYQHSDLVSYALTHLGTQLAPFHPFIDVPFIQRSFDHHDTAEFHASLFRGELNIRQPHPLFDVDFIRTQTQSDIQTLRDAFAWYWAADDNPATHALFDVRYYQSHFTSKDEARHSVYHYLTNPEAPSPQPLFDAPYYRDLARKAHLRGIKRPFEHFLVEGQKLGLDPSPYFDVAYYKQNTGCGTDALQHYVTGGHKTYSPHPLVRLEADQLQSWTAQHEGLSAGYRLHQCSKLVPAWITPDIDLQFLNKDEDAKDADPSVLRAHYFKNGYRENKRPNGLLSVPYIAAKLQALGMETDTLLKTYFRRGLHLRKRLLIALETMDDTPSNRVWLELLRDQLSNPDLDCVVVATGQGEMTPSFYKLAHVWNLSIHSDIATPLEQLQKSGTRLSEVIAANPPVAAFVEARADTTLLEALVDLHSPVIAFGARSLAISDLHLAERLGALSDKILCSSASDELTLQSMIKTASIPAISVLNTSAIALMPPAVRPRARKDLRAGLGLPAEAFLVLGHGPLDLVNGVDLFGGAAAACLSDPDCPADVHFIWQGTGRKFPDSPSFYARHFVQTAGGLDRFQIIDHIDFHDLLVCADLYLKLAREDTQTPDIAEAKAAGLPVVQSRKRTETASNSAGILFVDEYDINAAAEAVLRYARNPDERRQLGQAGGQDLQSGMNLAHLVRGLNEVLADISEAPLLRAARTVSLQESLLIVTSLSDFSAEDIEPGSSDFLDGQPVSRVDPAAIEAVTLPQSILSILQGSSWAEIVICDDAFGLSPATIARFGRAVWLADGVLSQIDGIYQKGLAFDEIRVRNKDAIPQISALNPKIAAITVVLDEPPQ